MAKSFTDQQQSVVKRLLGEFPVVDAKQLFRFTVKDEDVAKGSQKDPHSCAIARAVERYTGVKAIAIFHTVAYIPFDKKGDGKQVIERFSIDSFTRRAIEAFDRTGKFDPGEYKFNPPCKSERLGSQKKANAKQRALQQIKGVRKQSSTYKPNPKFIGVRNGTGHVAFVVSHPEA